MPATDLLSQLTLFADLTAREPRDCAGKNIPFLGEPLISEPHGRVGEILVVLLSTVDHVLSCECVIIGLGAITSPGEVNK